MKPTTIEEIEYMLEEIPDDAAFNSDIGDCLDDDDEFDPLHNATSFVDFDIENMGMLSSIKLV